MLGQKAWVFLGLQVDFQLISPDAPDNSMESELATAFKLTFAHLTTTYPLSITPHFFFSKSFLETSSSSWNFVLSELLTQDTSIQVVQLENKQLQKQRRRKKKK